MIDLNVTKRKPECDHPCALVYELDRDTDEELYECAKGTVMGPEVEVQVVVRA